MSEMHLEVVIRAKQTATIDEIKDLAMRKGVEDIECENDGSAIFINIVNTLQFSPFKEKADGKPDPIKLRILNIDDHVYADLLIKNNLDVYEVNEKLDLNLLLEAKKIFDELGLSSEDICYRVLYFYNGGCAGLVEVK